MKNAKKARSFHLGEKSDGRAFQSGIIILNMAKKNVTENAAVRIPSALIVILIGLSLVLAVVMLYPTTREYYLLTRENERLKIELQELTSRNMKIQGLIDSLETLEGIEDRAREEFGWVREGEEAVNITGLGGFESSTALPAVIDSTSIQVAEQWWTRILDRFFGVEKPVPVDPYPDGIIPGL
jgi:cell division protein FtsB